MGSCDVVCNYRYTNIFNRLIGWVFLMNYAVEQRMRFIDFLLAEYGYINRSGLIEYFGVSVPQASADFKHYLELAPQNMEYSKSKKVYEKTHKYNPIF